MRAWTSFRSRLRPLPGDHLSVILFRGRSVRVIRTVQRVWVEREDDWERYKRRTQEKFTFAIAAAQRYPMVSINGETYVGRYGWLEICGALDSEDIDTAHRELWRRAKLPPNAPPLWMPKKPKGWKPPRAAQTDFWR